MRRLQIPLAGALLFTALLICVYFATTIISGPISFLYNSAPGFTTWNNIAQLMAKITTVGLFIAAAFIAFPIAFQPGSWLTKILNVLPALFLLFTAVVILAAFAGVGTTGTLLMINGVGPITLAIAWITVGAVLSVIGVVIAAARGHFNVQILKNAVRVAALTGLPALVTCAAVIVTTITVASTQPSTRGFGGPGGQGGGGQNQGGPAAVGTDDQSGSRNGGQNQGGPGGPGAVSTSSANQDGGPAVGTQSAAQGNGGGRGGGRPGGGPDGGPGGPGGFGGVTTLVSRAEVGGVLVTIFALLGLGSVVGGLRAMGGTAALEAEPTTTANFPHEAGRSLLSAVAASVVIFAIIQLVPVTHDNPPVQSTVQWDSPQTATLWKNACANCHSNETEWPWYSYIAPSSWLTTLHVHDARAQFNISELNNMPNFIKSQFANNAAMHLRDDTMPPPDFRLLHPEARLTDAEKAELIQGLRLTLSK